MRLQKTRFMSLGAAALMMLLPLASPADAQPSGKFEVRLTSPISSDSSENAPIAAQVLTPPEFAGAILEGRILTAKSSGVVKKKSELVFKFETLYFNNQKHPIDGRVVSYYNSKGEKDTDDEGHIVKSSDPAKKAAIGAGIGAGIGALWANKTSKSGNKKSDTLKGAGVGAGVGAAAGLALAMTTNAPRIQFDTGSKFELDVQPSRPAQ